MESEFLDWLRQRLPTTDRAPLGLQDDAAWLRLARPETVVTTDLLTDGVDFRLEHDDPRRIGRKALAVNLSDLAAMAVRPVAAVISLVLPRPGGLALARELYEGLLPLADEFDCPIVGGDTNAWDGPLAISVTALGQPTERGPVMRSGARPGDAIVVTGAFGGSRLSKQFDFVPRIREALWLHDQARLHAAIDVSDGLTRDLAHIATASGCGAVLDLAAVPIADDARRMALDYPGLTPLERALGDGEDFELALAVPNDEAERLIRSQPLATPLTRIGEFVAERGLWQRAADNSVQSLTPRGWEH